MAKRPGFSILIFGVVTFLTGCQAIENHLIYDPVSFPQNWNNDFEPGIQDAWFVARDGTQLHGLYADHPQPRAYVLFAHGRSGNVTSLVENLDAFVKRYRVSVLIFDYRGYGKSEGQPFEEGLYQDGRAARKWLAQKAQVPESEIVMMGRSLGSAVAIELASADGARGLIIENGFTSLPDLIKHHVPPVPAERILNSRFDSGQKIRSYIGPVLVSHGTEDKIIPYEQGVELFRAAPGSKQFYAVAGGRHDWEPNSDYRFVLERFFDELPR